jgi:GTP 3',8-cyclase
MQSGLSLDGHKLLFHPEPVNKWLKGEDIYPLYCSISLTQSCNHRCIFCVYDSLKREKVFLDKDRILTIIKELGGNGLKALFFSGEGEPLVHPDISDIIHESKAYGIDCALNTNGYFLTREISESILNDLTFIRVSMNGCTPENYKKIHGATIDSYNRILDNLAHAVEIKKKERCNVTIGVQCIILRENIKSIHTLANDLKKIGVDYLAFKPFLPIDTAKYRTNLKLDDNDVYECLEKCEEIGDKDFKVIVRWESISKYEKRTYDKCLSLPFMIEIDSKGNVYPCGVLLGKDGYSYGNIYGQSYEEILHSEKCKEVMGNIYSKLDVHKCMPNCRNDAVNRFLWDLKHPPEHVNFI